MSQLLPMAWVERRTRPDDGSKEVVVRYADGTSAIYTYPAAKVRAVQGLSNRYSDLMQRLAKR